MFSRFFIDRPIFAAVIAIVITLAGGLAFFTLPMSQYPQITPPTVQVDCNYPGANAQTVAETIAAPIEQQVNGVEGMLYMTSQSTSDGSYTLTVTFKPGIDLNEAQVLLQNRVNLAMPQLPDVVRATGITTRKRSSEILMTANLYSPDNTYDQLYLSNYALVHIREELQRLPGISEVLLFGQRDYSMRVWLNPELMEARGLTPADVVAALREQNAQVAAGQVGQPPSPRDQALQITIDTLGRLQTPEQFEAIVVKADADGRVVRIKDVGNVKLMPKSQDVSNRFDGRPTVGVAIFMLSDANALETGDLVKAKLAEMSKDFPRGIVYEIGYDTTPFIRESVFEVFKTLRDAVILVSLVVLLFLQSWRSALIPLVAVPVAIIGTFAAMAAVGFSLNNLTLFGLVLAIGIVVDDAIVVVEAVEHHIELGLAPREATVRAMEEVSGPIVAVGLVLAAVFIPCAFISGIVGSFFRQFALTIAISSLISTVNSLTLSPALAALLLKSKRGRRDPATRLIDFAFGWLFRLFNRGFRASAVGYAHFVARSLRLAAVVLLVYGGLVALTIWEYRRLPVGFIPTTDKGYFLASVQLPDSAAVHRTVEVMAKLEAIAKNTKGVKNASSVAGNSFLLSAYGSNFGSMFIILDGFDKRRGDPGQTAEALLAKLRKRLASEIPEAKVNIFPAPAVQGLGRAGGFKLMIEDRGEVGLHTLQAVTDAVVRRGNRTPGLTGLDTVFKNDSPQLFLDIDRKECMQQGVDMAEVFSTLQGFLGARYVNDFNRFGRTWQVIVQADSRFRDGEEDIRKLKVRGRGGMVPLATIARVRQISSPLVITRYNMYPAAAITGNFAPGVSSGDAIATTEALCDQELPASMAYEWSELTYLEKTGQQMKLPGALQGYVWSDWLEKRLSSTTLAVVGAVLFVFLVLAALYESWKLPLAVILVVPMCVLGSLIGVDAAGQDINIFTQVGFVVLIGLACKNAILIVEFAKLRRDEGVPRREAVLAACRLRFRPILMTSCAFILGVLPLVVAKGAGAEMRQALGTAVFAGMIGVTVFGILLTPVFFYVVDGINEWRWDPAGWYRRAAEGVGSVFGTARRGAARVGRWVSGRFRQRAK
jgi:multidrug efflux pump